MNKFKDYNKRRFELPAVSLPKQSDLVKPDVPDKNKQILDMIYCVDSDSGRPSGDIAMFLGENTNDEVRTFIQKQLMNEVDTDKSQLNLSQDVVNNLRKTITDDDIARFSRNHDESIEDYAERMHNFFYEQKALREKKARISKLQKLIDGE